jgi:hypothetical protein
MRQPYAHEAVLVMAPDADLRAPGGAITVALCGAVDHEPPCPLAAHHTGAERAGGAVTVRVLFATDPAQEGAVRRRIEAALSGSWQVISSGPSPVAADEREHAARLTRSVA